MDFIQMLAFFGILGVIFYSFLFIGFMIVCFWIGSIFYREVILPSEKVRSWLERSKHPKMLRFSLHVFSIFGIYAILSAVNLFFSLIFSIAGMLF